MKPPADGDPGSDPTPTDELLARIIPLRHRNPQTPPPQEDQPPGADHEDAAPRKRSIWDPAACEPVLRRRTAPATPAGAPTPDTTRSLRPHALDAAIAGTAAIIATVLALSLTGPPGHSSGAPRQANALETHTIKPASTPPHHRARPHPSPKHTTARPRHATVRATQPRLQTPLPASSAPAPSAPARTTTPARPGGAELELTFERPPRAHT